MNLRLVFAIIFLVCLALPEAFSKCLDRLSDYDTPLTWDGYEYRAKKCPQCSNKVEPLCGTDGMSYLNECELRKFNCETGSNIRRLQWGWCPNKG